MNPSNSPLENQLQAIECLIEKKSRMSRILKSIRLLRIRKRTYQRFLKTLDFSSQQYFKYSKNISNIDICIQNLELRHQKLKRESDHNHCDFGFSAA